MFFSGKILTDSNTSFQTTLFGNESKAIMQQGTDRFVPIFDSIFITITIFLFIVVIITLFMLDVHPALIFFVFIAFCFVLIPVAIMSNIFSDINQDTTINSYTTNFSMTNWIMDHIVIVVCAIGSLAMIVLYARNKG